MMDFKRARKSRNIVAIRRTWESRCKHYRVIESHIPFAFGKYRGSLHLGYSDRYYATVLDVEGWSIISKHRKRKAAVRACNEHEKNHRGKDQGVGPITSRGNRGKAV